MMESISLRFKVKRFTYKVKVMRLKAKHLIFHIKLVTS